MLALINELCVNEIDEITNVRDNYWIVQGIDYLFGTDSEMDDEWDTELDNYLEECVYPDLPESMRNYFDDEAWKSDARMDLITTSSYEDSWILAVLPNLTSDIISRFKVNNQNITQSALAYYQPGLKIIRTS